MSDHLAEQRFLDVGGINTRYLEAGTEHPEVVVLVHGGEFGSYSLADDWRPIIGLLARSFHVIAVDSLGCGYTGNPDTEDDYLIDSVSRHIHSFIQEAGLGPVHLVGHSRGGFVAAQLALDHPDSLQSIVIVASGTLASPPNPIYEEWDRHAAKIADPHERVRYLVSVNSYSSNHIDDRFIEQVVDAVESDKTRLASATFAGEIRARFYRHLAERREVVLNGIAKGKLQLPTLVVWGYNDPSAAVETSAVAAMNLIMANVDRSELHVFNKAGHYSYREHPVAFGEVVEGFIRRAVR